MKKTLFTILTFLITSALFAFGSVELPESEFAGKFIVTADKVYADKVILVDARGKKGSTIKGAVVLSWQELSRCNDGKPGDANWGVILDKTRLDKKLGELGLDMNKPIVVFGDCGKEWGEEGRVAWQLISVGYPNVKFVDGGFNALRIAGFETVNQGAKLPEVKVNTKPVDLLCSIDTETLKSAYDTFKVIDVRNDDEYNGTTKYGEAKGGHLPKSIHIKFTDLFKDNGFLKSSSQIEKIFLDAGLKKTDKIVTYCTGGIRSAYMQLILQMLGFNAQNYDESFYRWCNVYEVE